MRFVAVFAAVVAISVVQMLVAAPFGLSWDLGRHRVALAAYIGGMVGVVAIVIVGPGPLDALTAFIRRLFRLPPKEVRLPADDGDPGRFARLVDRLGAPFLGVVGPMTIGGWAAAVLGIANGIGRAKLILWLAAGQAVVTASYVYSLAELTE